MAKTEKIYPGGIIGFKKHEKQPDFVLGTLIITMEDLVAWAKGEGKQYLQKYKGKNQLRLQLTQWEGRPSLCVDTFEPKGKKEEENDPF